MFRRVLAIWIMLLYVPSAIGMNVNIHFCHGKIASVNFGLIANEGCTCGGTKSIAKPKSSCCKDVHFKCELKSKQDASKSMELPAYSKTLAELPAFCKDYCPKYSHVAFADKAAASDPPDIGALPLYKRNRVFRI